MPKVVICEFMHEAGVGALSQDFETLYDPELGSRREDLKTAIADASAFIVRNQTKVSDELLAGTRELRVIGRLGVGLDNIDLSACERRGIEVSVASGTNSLAVAEYVVAATLMLVRKSYLSSNEVAKGDWPRSDLMGGEIAGRRFGLIGFGAIAQEVASRLKALGMLVSAYDPYIAKDHPAWQTVERLELNELLKSSDVVSLHVPLNDETHHLIEAERIWQMKPSAVLINTSRGGVVDEDALIDTLKSGHLSGAALDVFENEPLSAEAGAKFAGLANVILTPHVAGVTQESNFRTSMMIAEKVHQVLKGSS